MTIAGRVFENPACFIADNLEIQKERSIKEHSLLRAIEDSNSRPSGP